eukprot:12906604-Prorocentrum_lima.AAC.1
MCLFVQVCFHSDKERIFGDVSELCGGTAKVSAIMIRRRHYKVGPNFDAVVGIGLTQPQHVQELLRHIRECRPVR